MWRGWRWREDPKAKGRLLGAQGGGGAGAGRPGGRGQRAGRRDDQAGQREQDELPGDVRRSDRGRHAGLRGVRHHRQHVVVQGDPGRDRRSARRPGRCRPTEQTTMAIVCRGVMPTALNTPRSCTRSLVCSTTVLSTPSPATAASSSVSVAIRPMTAAARCGCRCRRDGVVRAERCGQRVSRRRRRAVPGRRATSYWAAVSCGSRTARVARLADDLRGAAVGLEDLAGDPHRDVPAPGRDRGSCPRPRSRCR